MRKEHLHVEPGSGEKRPCLVTTVLANSVTSKKSPNVCKSCPKILLPQKIRILTPLQKLPKNVGDLGKLIVATDLESCPKFNKLCNLVTLLGRDKIGQKLH